MQIHSCIHIKHIQHMLYQLHIIQLCFTQTAFRNTETKHKKVWIFPVLHCFFQGTPDSRPTFAVVVPDFQWQIPCCASGWYTACRSQWLLTLEKKAKKNEAKREKTITFKWDSDAPDWYKLYVNIFGASFAEVSIYLHLISNISSFNDHGTSMSLLNSERTANWNGVSLDFRFSWTSPANKQILKLLLKSVIKTKNHTKIIE